MKGSFPVTAGQVAEDGQAANLGEMITMICISNSTNRHSNPLLTTFVPDEFLPTVGRALSILLTGMRDNKQ